MKKVDYFGRYQLVSSTGASEQMLFKHGRGLRQPMGQQSCGIQTLEGKCPTVLPVKCQAGKDGERGEHPKKTAISDTMQASDEGRASCDPSSGQ